MFDFHEKRKIRRIIYSKPFIGSIFVLTLLMGRSVYERYTIEREMEKKLDARTAELHTLEDRAALLETKVDHLKNDRGIEEELRTRFDVVEEGEKVVIIIDDKDKKDEKELTNPVPAPSESFLEKLKFW